MKFRRVCTGMLLVSSILCGCAQAEKPDNPYRLKTQIHETYRDGETSCWRFEYTYDENGWYQQYQSYINDIPDTVTVYSRDEFGNTTGYEIIHPDGSRDVSEEKLTLNKENRVVYSESYWNGVLNGTTEYGYNEDGQVTKLYINRIGALEGQDWKSFTDNTYDRKGNLIRADVRWEPDDEDSSYTLRTYQKDRLIRDETYKGEELDSYTDYTYDETRLVQTAIAYKADGTLQTKHVTTFDEYGNKLEVVAFAYATEMARFGETDEEPDSRTTYIYE